MSSDMHIDGDGPTVFAHACKMGLEGIERAACSSVSSDAEESWPVVCAELLSLQNYISGRT